MARLTITRFALVALAMCGLGPFAAPPVVAEELGRSEFVDSGGVKLHCVTQGKGPLLVMIHGFPDFWYTWLPEAGHFVQHDAADVVTRRMVGWLMSK